MLAEVDTLCNPIKIELWKGIDTRPTCVVTMNPTQAGQSGAVGTESASPGPSQTETSSVSDESEVSGGFAGSQIRKNINKIWS